MARKTLHLVLAMLVLATLALGAGGCTTSAAKGLPDDGGPPLASFDDLLVFSFRDDVSKQDKSTRAVKGATMRGVVSDFAQRIADATEGLRIFDSVRRKGKPGRKTLIVTGKITAYRNGNQLAPLPLIGKAFDDKRAFAAVVEIIDGSDRAVLTTMNVDMASLPPTGPAFTGLLRGPAETVAARLYELRVGKPVPASYYIGQPGAIERTPDRKWNDQIQK
ncbi:MAG: hypothetical protein V3R77_01400 [Candidatus Binatia bacterium]